MTAEFFPTVCPHDCPSACALEVERIDSHTIGKVRGAKANSYTQGVICSKVARYAERVHHPDRLTRPMKRVGPRGEERFVPVSWDEALDEVAQNFQRIAGEYGSEAIWPYYYAGTMGQLQRDGIHRLRHGMGYSGQKGTICTALAYAGWKAGVGAAWGSDPRQMVESDLIVLWGCNAVATQVNVMTLVSKAKRCRGAKLVVVDPYRTATAAKADIHLMPRPGTDGALACAVMHLLFAEGYADRAYLQKYTDVPELLEQHLSERSPEWAAGITGIPAEDIRQFARLFGKTKRSFIRLGIGFSRSRNGAHNVHAVSCLPAVTGAWQYPGGGALLGTSDLFHLDKTLIEGQDLRNPDIRVLDMSRIGSILCGNREDLGGDIPVKALFIQNTNPMLVAPDLNAVHKGFAREDLFICVHEQFMTETARMADILLPATTFLEHDDLYQSYGQMHLQMGPAVISPPGECRSNHQLICDLAKRLGAEHPGFEMSAAEVIDATLKASGYPALAELTEQRWLDCSKDFNQMNFIDGFSWPDGRFRFKPEWRESGPLGSAMPELPDHWDIIDNSDEERPFRLITPPARTFLNSTFTETPGSRKKESAPRLLIHTKDAASLTVDSGDRVVVGNQRGEIDVEAQITPGIASGVVAIEGIWPGDHFPGGQGANVLISSDIPGPNGGAVFHDTAVWVRKTGTSTDQ